ncbi:glycosyltransferase family 4 protein [Mesorhizobium sp. CGMCC 1.15528]|uniref:Glycosyltransferase family 4 protein n=1 Tax=Mesorhizobium zhangyense TaxID=1776730 RepID=A0A7C9VB61_9HYPH|nr:glycosyltransferase family 4 protein [Mesorhizobium zhangyense]NGN40208.1 glycosyltransferase family 4 protein [Mesorhizobium zhangyense]
MTKVVVICNDQEYFLRHRLAVVEKLVRTGAEVTVITGGQEEPLRKPEGWTFVHMPIERFSFRPLGDLAIVARSARLIAAIRPDAVHLITLKPAVFSGFAAVLARLVGRGPRRILVTIPGLGRLMSPAAASSGTASASRAVVRRAIRFLSDRPGVYFTFETSHDRNLWLSDGLIRENNSTVINGAGVNPDTFHPTAGKAARDSIKVLFASRLLKAKGLDAFIDAAKQYADRADVEFIVAGMIEPNDPDGYSPEELWKEPAISFLGEVTDMPALLRDVDLVCLPTRYGEGIPRILIEAAASGIACLATDLEGCKEIVEDGVSGTLVPASEPEALAKNISNAVDAYLQNPELLRTQGAAGYQRFLSGGFSEEAVVGHFLDLLTGPGPDRV